MLDSPYRRVVVAIDGSAGADVATRVAFTIVGTGREIAFLHVTDRAAAIANYIAPRGSDLGALESIEQEEQRLFTSARKSARALGFQTSCHAVDGVVQRAIVDYIRSTRADAVLMGSSADPGIARAMLAATGAVIRTAGIPIFVCPERYAPSRDHRIRRIMVAIDASEPSANAVGRAIAIARWTGAKIEFANVQERDAERRCKDRIASTVACEQATQAGVHADAIVLHGPTAEALTAAALANGADLIVVGTHARAGRARLRYGSVAEAVARGRAECPVMVVPCGPPAASRVESVAAS